ncbi:MAG: nucleotide exchange factor GrpE [Chloroflexota bacterium]|jgi:molecular chaperone GrpE|nr:nucleotide exchange factor GrpE [Chloroflexota bacterium]
MAKETKKDKEIKSLEKKIIEISSEKDKYLDIAQRAQADLVNYRKKVSIDNKESDDRAQRKIFMQIINVLDQMNMALTSKIDNKSFKSWIKGIESVNSNFKNLLSNFDFEELNLSKNEKFDPNKHEAISRVETDEFEEGEIVRQVSPGYKHKDYLLRPILVEIAFKK